MTARIKILYEDNHLLVIVKPAGIATQGTRDEPSVVTWARDYLKEKYDKPGNVYVGVVSRLDKPVSGVLVLARTSKAAARLSEQFRRSSVSKFYLAVVEGCPHDDRGSNRHESDQHSQRTDSGWHERVDWVTKSEQLKRMIVVPRKSSHAVEARLRWQCIRQAGDQALLRIELLTGRKHQIRLQLAQLGCPIVGDPKYGSPPRGKRVSVRLPGRPLNRSDRNAAVGRERRRRDPDARIALHAERLIFQHPVRDETLEFTAPPPAWWQSLAVQI